MVGLMLLYKGIHLLAKAAQYAAVGDSSFLIQFIEPLAGSLEQAALVLIVIGLFLGFIKGRSVLAKAAGRNVARIRALPDPLPIKELYALKDLLVLLLMVVIGLSLRWMDLPHDLHGLIDVAIGSGLINGAICYYRQLIPIHRRG